MVSPEQNEAESSLVGLPFTERDVREAARLLALIANSDLSRAVEAAEPRLRSIAEPADPELLLRRARRHLRERQLRKEFFNRATFGEPAWDTLLVLYISEFSGRRLTVGRLADWIDAPLSTTQRWIAYLEKERLIDKEGHPQDRRMAYVRLLDKGRAMLSDYFAAMPE